MCLKKHAFLCKSVAVVVVISFLWSNVVYASGLTWGVRAPVLDTLAAGSQLGPARALLRVVRQGQTLRDLGIGSIADLVSRAAEVRDAGIEGFPGCTADGHKVADWIVLDGVLFRITEGVNVTADRLLEAIGQETMSEAELIGSYTVQSCPDSDFVHRLLIQAGVRTPRLGTIRVEPLSDPDVGTEGPQAHLFPRYIHEAFAKKLSELRNENYHKWSRERIKNLLTYGVAFYTKKNPSLFLQQYSHYKYERKTGIAIDNEAVAIMAEVLNETLGKDDITEEAVKDVLMLHEEIEKILGEDESYVDSLYDLIMSKQPAAVRQVDTVLRDFGRNYVYNGSTKVRKESGEWKVVFESFYDGKKTHVLDVSERKKLLREMLVHHMVECIAFGQPVRGLGQGFVDLKEDRIDLEADVYGLMSRTVMSILTQNESRLRLHRFYEGNVLQLWDKIYALSDPEGFSAAIGGGMMGRWEYTWASLDDDTGILTLNDATRIARKDGVIEEEFLIDGENERRNIELETVGLRVFDNGIYYEQVEKIKRDLSIGNQPGVAPEVRVIVGNNAIRHRIYGVGTEQVIFIRDAILREGSEEQIKEAIDHEAKHREGHGHDEARVKQFTGGLRELIRNISTEDKKMPRLGRIRVEPLNDPDPDDPTDSDAGAEVSQSHLFPRYIHEALADKLSELHAADSATWTEERINNLLFFGIAFFTKILPEGEHYIYDAATGIAIDNEAVDIAVDVLNGVLPRGNVTAESVRDVLMLHERIENILAENETIIDSMLDRIERQSASDLAAFDTVLRSFARNYLYLGGVSNENGRFVVGSRYDTRQPRISAEERKTLARELFVHMLVEGFVFDQPVMILPHQSEDLITDRIGLSARMFGDLGAAVMQVVHEQFDVLGLSGFGVQDGMEAYDKICDLYGTGYRGTMGRWKYEDVIFDESTGVLILRNATRIPRRDGVVEEEFLIDGENEPRDIELETKALSDVDGVDAELVSRLKGELEDASETRVIVGGNVSLHRIYGVADAGLGMTFIRDKVFQYGNNDQIREALDHESRELSEEDHVAIRAQQYKGGLRELIRKISDEDKKRKTEAEIIAALKSDKFPALTLERLQLYSDRAEDLVSREVLGMLINPITGKFQELEFWGDIEDIAEKPYAAWPYKIVECTLYEKIDPKRAYNNLWVGNIVPIMGDEIYHRDGRPFTNEELGRAGLRKICNREGRPIKIKALRSSGHRTVTIPGPWIVPYVETESDGEFILTTINEVAELTEATVTVDNLNQVLVNLAEEGIIRIRYASSIQFKGAGCYDFPPVADLPEAVRALDGENVCIPGLAVGDATGRKCVYDGVGVASHDHTGFMEVEEDMRQASAVILADSVDYVDLFEADSLVEIDDLEEEVLRRRPELATPSQIFRLGHSSEVLQDWIHSEDAYGGYIHTKIDILRAYISEVYGESNYDAYVRQVFINLARNMRVCLPWYMYRSEDSNVPHNWGAEFQIIDLSVRDFREIENPGTLAATAADIDFDECWQGVWDYFQVVYRALLDNNKADTLDHRYFQEVFLEELFQKNAEWAKENIDIYLNREVRGRIGPRRFFIHRALRKMLDEVASWEVEEAAIPDPMDVSVGDASSAEDPDIEPQSAEAASVGVMAGVSDAAGVSSILPSWGLANHRFMAFHAVFLLEVVFVLVGLALAGTIGFDLLSSFLREEIWKSIILFALPARHLVIGIHEMAHYTKAKQLGILADSVVTAVQKSGIEKSVVDNLPEAIRELYRRTKSEGVDIDEKLTLKQFASISSTLIIAKFRWYVYMFLLGPLGKFPGIEKRGSWFTPNLHVRTRGANLHFDAAGPLSAVELFKIGSRFGAVFYILGLILKKGLFLGIENNIILQLFTWAAPIAALLAVGFAVIIYFSNEPHKKKKVPWRVMALAAALIIFWAIPLESAVSWLIGLGRLGLIVAVVARLDFNTDNKALYRLQEQEAEVSSTGSGEADIDLQTTRSLKAGFSGQDPYAQRMRLAINRTTEEQLFSAHQFRMLYKGRTNGSNISFNGAGIVVIGKDHRNTEVLVEKIQRRLQEIMQGNDQITHLGIAEIGAERGAFEYSPKDFSETEPIKKLPGLEWVPSFRGGAVHLQEIHGDDGSSVRKQKKFYQFNEEQVLKALYKAICDVGAIPYGTQRDIESRDDDKPRVMIGIDVGADSLAEAHSKKKGQDAPGNYVLDLATGQPEYNSVDLTKVYDRWRQRYGVGLLIDPLSGSDIEGYVALQEEIGDDIYVASSSLPFQVQEDAPARKQLQDIVVINPADYGTFTETLLAIKVARKNGLQVMLKRSGAATTDAMLAELSFATGAAFEHFGPARGVETLELVDQRGVYMDIIDRAEGDGSYGGGEYNRGKPDPDAEDIYIKDIYVDEQLTGNRVPTVRVIVELSDNYRLVGDAPVGISIGEGQQYEGERAAFLVDGVKEAYNGNGVKKAVDNFNAYIREHFIGRSIFPGKVRGDKTPLGNIIDIERELLQLEKARAVATGQLRTGATDEEIVRALKKKQALGANALSPILIALSRIVALREGKTLRRVLKDMYELKDGNSDEANREYLYGFNERESSLQGNWILANHNFMSFHIAFLTGTLTFLFELLFEGLITWGIFAEIFVLGLIFAILITFVVGMLTLGFHEIGHYLEARRQGQLTNEVVENIKVSGYERGLPKLGVWGALRKRLRDKRDDTYKEKDKPKSYWGIWISCYQESLITLRWFFMHMLLKIHVGKFPGVIYTGGILDPGLDVPTKAKGDVKLEIDSKGPKWSLGLFIVAFIITVPLVVFTVFVMSHYPEPDHTIKFAIKTLQFLSALSFGTSVVSFLDVWNTDNNALIRKWRRDREKKRQAKALIDAEKGQKTDTQVGQISDVDFVIRSWEEKETHVYEYTDADGVVHQEEVREPVRQQNTGQGGYHVDVTVKEKIEYQGDTIVKVRVVVPIGNVCLQEFMLTILSKKKGIEAKREIDAIGTRIQNELVYILNNTEGLSDEGNAMEGGQAASLQYGSIKFADMKISPFKDIPQKLYDGEEKDWMEEEQDGDSSALRSRKKKFQLPEEEVIKALTLAIIGADCLPGQASAPEGKEDAPRVFIAIDGALSTLADEYNRENYKRNRPFEYGRYLFYKLDDKRIFTSDDIVNWLKRLRVRGYPIWSIEDLADERDGPGFQAITEEFRDNWLVVGDDNVTTNPISIRKALNEDQQTATLIKYNQIGSLSEAACALVAALEGDILYKKFVDRLKDLIENLDFIRSGSVADLGQYQEVFAEAIEIIDEITERIKKDDRYYVVPSHRSQSPDDWGESILALAASVYRRKFDNKRLGGAIAAKFGGFLNEERQTKWGMIGVFVDWVMRKIKHGKPDKEKYLSKGKDIIIQDIHAYEIRCNSGSPTVRVYIRLSNGYEFTGACPIGTSAGGGEAMHLADGNKSEFAGKGCSKAVDNVNKTFHRHFKGKSIWSLGELENIDQQLLLLEAEEFGRGNLDREISEELLKRRRAADDPNDVSHDEVRRDVILKIQQEKRKLGMNAILPTSLAFCRLLAYRDGMPEWLVLRNVMNRVQDARQDHDRKRIELRKEMLEKLGTLKDRIQMQDTSAIGNLLGEVEGFVTRINDYWKEESYDPFVERLYNVTELTPTTPPGPAGVPGDQGVAGPIAKLIPPEKREQGQQDIWEMELRDGEFVDAGSVLNVSIIADRSIDIDNGIIKPLQRAIRRTVSYHDDGLGILSGIDVVRVSDNLKLEEKEGKVPYAAITEEGGSRVMYIDYDAFSDEDLLFVEVEHEFSEGMMKLLPLSDREDEESEREQKAVRELTTNYLSLLAAIRNDITNIDQTEVRNLDPDSQYLLVLSYIYEYHAEVARRIRGNDQVSSADKKILLALLLEHMRNTPYYKDLHKVLMKQKMGFWNKSMEAAEHRFEAAVDIFDQINAATRILERVNRVEVRLENVEQRYGKMISQVKAIVGEIDADNFQFVEALITDKKYVRIDIDELEKNEWLLKWFKDMSDRVETTPFIFYSETKQEDAVRASMDLEGLKGKLDSEIEMSRENTITLVDPTEVTEGMAENTLYLPLPYTITSVFLASEVIREQSVSRLYALKSIYQAMLNRPVTDAEIEQLIINPARIILPALARITNSLDAVQKAIIAIEKSA